VAEQIGVVPLYRGAQYLVVRHPAKTKARAIRQLESLGYKVNLESLADTA
jgi:transposase